MRVTLFGPDLLYIIPMWTLLVSLVAEAGMIIKVNHIQTTYGTKNWSYWSGKSILGVRGKGWGVRGNE